MDDKVLRAAFIPFGDITDTQIPLDCKTGQSFFSVSHVQIPNAREGT